jgi:hypothetical protein
MNQTGYAAGNGSAAGPSTAAVQGSEQIADHAKLKRQFTEYLSVKDAEIKEQKEARRYHHGSQYTDKQIKILNQRKQPVVTYNRISRKINALIGFLDRMRTDPRAYPRTPQHDDGAEIATAVLRYVCDEQDWETKSPTCGQNGAVDGIGGVELIIEKGDMGDPEIGLEVVDPSGFFYDPRSLKPDFSDARYMGSAKWADLEAAIEMFPDKEEELRSSVETGNDLSSNPDSDRVWINGTENNRQIRIVDHWYIKNGDWYWCIYTGSINLAEGLSYVKDEKKRTICKYIMYSANIDQDGDRYGFVRNMKSSQDEINQRRSKALHTLNSRRVIIEQGSVEDVERVRREAARPDGVIEIAPGTTPPQFDDNARGQELQGQMAFLEDAKNEIENYGFNPALIGQGVQDMSGRAIQLQQQAGVAELGPFTLGYRGWKIRVYRAVWCAVQEHWTSERWVRVTDDQKLARFFSINKLSIDPRTGTPVIVNAIGALDVDIIIDEGPDEINMQAANFDLLTALARSGQPVPAEVLIELSDIDSSVKQRVLSMLQQAKQAQSQDPQKQALLAAQLDETNSAAILKRAQAQKAIADAGTPKPQPGGPTDLDVAKAVADIHNVQASTAKTFADARKSNVEAALKPVQAANEAARTRQQAQRNLT